MLQRNRPGFTLLELLAVIIILVLAVALLIPALQVAREYAAGTTCANNLNNLGMAFFHRVDERGQPFTSDEGWMADLMPFAENNLKLFQCPNDTDIAQASVAGTNRSSKTSFGVNNRASGFTGTDSDKVLLVEYEKIVAYQVAPNATDNWPQWVGIRHRGQVNVLFRNGSVKQVKPISIDPRQSAIYDKHWLPEGDKP